METVTSSRGIRLAIVGLGNCASSLIEGISYYRQNPHAHTGLLFPRLCGYTVADIDVVAAFDIAAAKVGKSVQAAIYEPPNDFVRIPNVGVDCAARVYRGPTLDGNPPHLASLVRESPHAAVDPVVTLKQARATVVVNMLPTGSIEATEFYADAAVRAGCAFVNCIPTRLAQREDMQARYGRAGLPLLGDDIKSQLGTTILHRALLHLLEARGAVLQTSSQINVGGNTDFANLIRRPETKLASKRKSLARYVGAGEQSHVGHHYDPTRGPLKNAFIDIEAAVFGRSRVKLSVRLESDDKPNCAGSVVDLVRVAQGALDRRRGGFIPEACAFYCKSPPEEMEDLEALRQLRQNWTEATL